MKLLFKVALCVVSLAGLVFSVCILSLFYNIPYITYNVEGYRRMFPWLNGVFACFAAVICLCFLLLTLISVFSPSKAGDVVMTRDKGTLKFSRQSVESAVRYSFADVEGISFCKVRARIYGKPEKTKILVKLALADPGSLVGLTETVQARIEAALKASLGIDAKRIHIDVAGVTAGGNDGIGGAAPDGSRVV